MSWVKQCIFLVVEAIVRAINVGLDFIIFIFILFYFLIFLYFILEFFSFFILDLDRRSDVTCNIMLS